MRELRELVGVITRHKIKSIETLGPSLPPTSKIMKFYRGISSGVLNSDEEALLFLYGDPDSGRNSYWKLKHDLKKRLLNTLFFIDQKQTRQTAYEKTYYNCYREFTAARFLLRRGARKAAMELLHKTYKKARQIELTPVILETLQLLRHHYGVILGDRQKFEEYHKRVQYYQQLYLAEARADGFLEELLSHYVKDKSTKKHYHDMAMEYEMILKEALTQVQSRKLQHRMRFISVAKSMIVNDYEATVDGCVAAVQYFKGFRHIPDAFIRPYLYQLVVSFIQMEEYEKGEAAVKQLLEMLEQGQSNWFKGMELYCILALHSRSYYKAFEVWKECTNHPQFRNLYPSAREPWYIIEAFIQYTYQAGKIGPDLEQSRFRVTKFLNEVPVFAKDMRGYNIPILIIQILFLLHQGDQEAVNERLDALSRYALRHFHRGEHYRTNCFIKMLNQLPKAFFEKGNWKIERPSIFTNCKTCHSCLPGKPMRSRSFPMKTSGRWCWTG
ncbi:MAG: hypothetical protein IPJ40_13905 [Saprospirales bacterium]|nr:hypothetical protein [Saprospirales bacterium]